MLVADAQDGGMLQKPPDDLAAGVMAVRATQALFRRL